jgi:ATP dependent DNA ligase C terminal region
MFNHDEGGSPMFEVTTVGIDLAKNVSSVHGVDHHVEVCPFVDLPNPKSSRWGGGVTAGEMREMQWVKPKLVAQVRFVEWTAEGRLRHAAFLGLRPDKSAREVRREANEGTS